MARNIKQGESAMIEGAVLQSGNPVDLTTATDVIVSAFSNVDNTHAEEGKWSLQPLANHGSLQIKSGVGNENIVQIEVSRDQSKLFTISAPLNFYIKTSTPDGNFSDGTREDEYTLGILLVTREGITKDENI